MYVFAADAFELVNHLTYKPHRFTYSSVIFSYPRISCIIDFLYITNLQNALLNLICKL